MAWLNQNSSPDKAFYLIHARPSDQNGIIDCCFTTVISPSDKWQAVSSIAPELCEQLDFFWNMAFEYFAKHRAFPIQRVDWNCTEIATEIPGFVFYLSVFPDKGYIACEVFLNSRDRHKIYNKLEREKAIIEQELHCSLDWDDGNTWYKACSIIAKKTIRFQQPNSQEDASEWLFYTSQHFLRTFLPRITAITDELSFNAETPTSANDLEDTELDEGLLSFRD